MIERVVNGTVPRKHHLQHKDETGALLWEQCLTQEGFEAPYTITYHRHAPHRQMPIPTTHRFAAPRLPAGLEQTLLKRHFLSQQLPASGKSPLNSRLPLLFNTDVTLSVLKPGADDPIYFINADGDDLFYIHEGGGTLRSVLGDLDFGPGDYVYVPRGVLHRFVLDSTVAQWWLSIECRGGMHIPKQWRNGIGQLRMDAPYCHRDFRKPTFRGPLDEGILDSVVKRQDAFYGFTSKTPPLDVVGWDGTVYPFAFHILNFQPRVGLTHLPPTWHGTFAARGALICSFVPRPVDFHPEAIPCPYPHASIDVDEFLFYCKGNFTSRRGVGPGSMSYHPAGIPHGPHPGAYEASIGHKETNELAVMLDCMLPLTVTQAAQQLEDPKYQSSFLP
jgi:homogentisate 1,2-dioxygenase